METTNRIEWIDALKGFAILSLIVYHFYLFDWLNSPVGIFFLLSGLFFKKRDTFVDFVRGKVKALLVPFVFFYVLGIIVLYVGDKVLGHSFSYPPIWLLATLLPSTYAGNPIGVGAIWFLLSLFEIYGIYYLMRCLTTKTCWLLVIAFISLVVSALLMHFFNKASLFFLFNSFFFLAYFVVGHVFKNFFIKGHLTWWLILFLMAAYCMRFIGLSDVGTTMWGGILLILRDFVSGLSKVILLVFIFRKFENFCNKKLRFIHCFLLFEGKNSLTILGVHLLFQMVMGSFLMIVFPLGPAYWMSLFILLVIGCNASVMLFNRYVPFLVNQQNKTRL